MRSHHAAIAALVFVLVLASCSDRDDNTTRPDDQENADTC
jgi:uncharacterized lipoprotein